VDELNLVMSASESHNLTNLRMTREQSYRSLRQVSRLADTVKIPFNISLSCVRLSDGRRRF
jgi:hydroxymethylglutaryl-CoA lyase